MQAKADRSPQGKGSAHLKRLTADQRNVASALLEVLKEELGDSRAAANAAQEIMQANNAAVTPFIETLSNVGPLPSLQRVEQTASERLVESLQQLAQECEAASCKPIEVFTRSVQCKRRRDSSQDLQLAAAAQKAQSSLPPTSARCEDIAESLCNLGVVKSLAYLIVTSAHLLSESVGDIARGNTQLKPHEVYIGLDHMLPGTTSAALENVGAFTLQVPALLRLVPSFTAALQAYQTRAALSGQSFKHMVLLEAAVQGWSTASCSPASGLLQAMIAAEQAVDHAWTCTFQDTCQAIARVPVEAAQEHAGLCPACYVKLCPWDIRSILEAFLVHVDMIREGLCLLPSQPPAEFEQLQKTFLISMFPGVLEELSSAFDSKNANMAAALVLLAARHVETLIQIHVCRSSQLGLSLQQFLLPALEAYGYVQQKLPSGMIEAITHIGARLPPQDSAKVSRLCQIRTMLLETGGLSSTNFWAMKALTHILDIDATYRRSPAVSKAANALLAGFPIIEPNQPILENVNFLKHRLHKLLFDHIIASSQQAKSLSAHLQELVGHRGAERGAEYHDMVFLATLLSDRVAMEQEETAAFQAAIRQWSSYPGSSGTSGDSGLAAATGTPAGSGQTASTSMAGATENTGLTSAGGTSGDSGLATGTPAGSGQTASTSMAGATENTGLTGAGGTSGDSGLAAATGTPAGSGQTASTSMAGAKGATSITSESIQTQERQSEAPSQIKLSKSQKRKLRRKLKQTGDASNALRSDDMPPRDQSGPDMGSGGQSKGVVQPVGEDAKQSSGIDTQLSTHSPSHQEDVALLQDEPQAAAMSTDNNFAEPARTATASAVPLKSPRIDAAEAIYTEAGSAAPEQEGVTDFEALPKPAQRGMLEQGQPFLPKLFSGVSLAAQLQRCVLGDERPEAASSEPLEPCGLVNTGNLCFMNSILQAVMGGEDFSSFLRQLQAAAPELSSPKLPVLHALANLAGEYWRMSLGNPAIDAPKFDGLKPRALLPTMMFPIVNRFCTKEDEATSNAAGTSRQKQEDAEEFLSYLLRAMHQELLHLDVRTDTRNIEEPHTKKTEDCASEWKIQGRKHSATIQGTTYAEEGGTLISELFGGALASKVDSQGSPNSVTVQPFFVMPLSIPIGGVSSITDALNACTTPESISGFKDKNGKTVRACRVEQLYHLPRILVLQLKRFAYDTNLHRIIKIKKTIKYGERLRIEPSWVSQWSPQPSYRAGADYQLIATVLHHGEMATSGHYTANVRQPDNSWVCCDDDKLSVVSIESVLNDARTYLLFYQLRM